jgi:hypothetical protein
LFLLKGNPLLMMTMMINATVIRCSYRDDWCVEEARSRSRQTRRTEAATEYKGKKEGGLEGSSDNRRVPMPTFYGLFYFFLNMVFSK